MAAYFPGSPEMQPDGLQTLYLMNPGFAGYADTPAAPNMMLLNSTMDSVHLQNQHQQEPFVGIPIQNEVHELMPGIHYNIWPLPPPPDSIDRRASVAPTAAAQQGLSLSLSPHKALYSYLPEHGVADMAPLERRAPQSFLMESKYLKVAQLLLDEVVNVFAGLVGSNSKSTGKTSRGSDETAAITEREMGAERGSIELTTAERQELQMRKAKLVNMLDEVEQRYRQYHQQMEMVAATFESVAGQGSARAYTALALKTISKHFRCLRDTIAGQVRAIGKSLGEDEGLGRGGKPECGSRLRFVDHQLRQQRALQQLGMIQHNAWRPQRGLPEHSVSVLRAWLFEHFLHPYPKDSDKLMLAKQTGLTRSQVSNWFINARVRLWKPMVEEMYLEEVKEHEQNNGDDKSKSDAKEDSTSKSSAHIENSPSRTDQNMVSLHLPSYNDNDSIMQPMFKKARIDETISNPVDIELKSDEMKNHEFLISFGQRRQSTDESGYPLIPGIASNEGGFGTYPIGDIGRFDHEQFTPRYAGNGVSLTLGLPHNEGLSLTRSRHPYLSSEGMSNEVSDYCSLNNSSSAVVQPSSAYDTITIQSQKRFAAQLLPDFVA